jgi:uncharacterized protein DUF2510
MTMPGTPPPGTPPPANPPPATPPPNWYPDPSGAGGFRWWDGHGWTAFTGPPQPGAAGRHARRLARGVGAGALVLTVIGLILSRHRVTVQSGPAVVWLGVALIGAAVLMSLLVPKVHIAIRIVVAVALVAGLVSGFLANRWVDRHRHPATKPVATARVETGALTPTAAAIRSAARAPDRARCGSTDAR